MPADHGRDLAPGALARRALTVSIGLSLVGSALGAIGIVQGVITGALVPLILSCVAFTSVTLAALSVRGGPSLQTIATAATLYFVLYLSAGAVIAITGPPAGRVSVVVFFVWFFALRVLNELVNAPAVGRLLTRCIVLAPIGVAALFAPRLFAIFPLNAIFVLVGSCVGYLGFSGMFGIITRYREDFVAQRERAESFKVESAILESISDCFISLDANFELIYVNDAACAEFAVDRESVLHGQLSVALAHFVSAEMVEGLESACDRDSVTAFDAQNRTGDRWYEMRCFPKANGLSVYFQNITTRRIAEAKIEHLAFHDALTSLPNRVLLRQRLNMVLAAAARRNVAGALLFIDLDDFKTLNDTLGHDAGDRYLQEIAQRLTSCVRREDTVARFGGDEFVVLLESLGDDLHQAGAHVKYIADKILAALAVPYRTESIELSSTAGIGIAFFGATPDTADDVLKRADLAMYRAKASGRNGIAFFDPAMQSSVSARAALLADLRVALAQREFTLYYQPQVDRGGSVVGAEALLRWPHAQRGMVSPAEFIPLAEEAGLIGELGRWVLATACAELARWSRHSGMETLTLAVNVSLRQFADPLFVSVVLDAVHEAHADPRRLKLELTESSAMQNVDDTIAKMTELKRHGIGFSIDDFGTGYSSLSHLKRLPLDQLKIDRSFVSDISSDRADVSIVRTLVALGTSLGLGVIAEGVETAAQRLLLEREGCFLFQGFFYSPALPAAEFTAFALGTPSRAMLEA